MADALVDREKQDAFNGTASDAEEKISEQSSIQDEVDEKDLQRPEAVATQVKNHDIELQDKAINIEL